ncbi:MAG: DUF58 domain-containing protein [Azonexus sp.]
MGLQTDAEAKPSMGSMPNSVAVSGKAPFWRRFFPRLFPAPRPQSAPCTLTRRNIYILPNRSGLLFALMLLTLLIGAINYNLALGHALVFLLAALGLVSMVHAFRNLHGLSLAARRASPVFAGDMAQFELALDNPTPRPRCALRLWAKAELPLDFSVTANSQDSVLVALPSQQRGWLELPRLRLESRYPLGFFTAWSLPWPALRVLVYPQPSTRPLPETIAASSAAGTHASAGGEDFSGLRERQPGDPLRHVAWKAEARSDGQGPLLVKEFSGTSSSELLLDWAYVDPLFSVEERLSILCGWVLRASQEQRRFALRLPGIVLASDSGETHRLRCLEALALYPG